MVISAKLNILVVFLVSIAASAQSYTVRCRVHNQPDELPVTLGSVSGDQFTPFDSAWANNGVVSYRLLPGKPPGVYRLVFGQTLSAKIMNEPAQQLDFVFNREDVELETDFNAPLEKAVSIRSEENRIWFDFQKADVLFRKQMNEWGMQINYFQKNPTDNYYNEAKKKSIIETYNQLQKNHQRTLLSIEMENPDLLVTKMIKISREPYLDGNLTEMQRNNLFKRDFFQYCDFSDETLIHSSVYTQKVMKYILAYGQKGLSRDAQEKEFIKAVEVILAKTASNDRIARFIVDYLMRGFERLQLNQVLLFIAEHFQPMHASCSSDEKTTLERRLASQMMKNGTEVPDFLMTDINGKKISLGEITCDFKLLIFWSTWCPHCSEMLPQLHKWYQTREIDLEVIAISVDTCTDDWQRFVKSGKYQWISCNEPHQWNGPVAKMYHLYATPSLFLVDRKNRILAKPYDWGELMEVMAGLGGE